MAATGALAPRCRGCARPALRWCALLGGAGPLPRPPAALGACMGGVGRAGTGPRLRRHCPALACSLRDLKGMRPCLAAVRLRLNPDSAPAGAPRGAARSGGARLPRPGRPLRSGCSPLRLRGCCAALRPRSPLAPRLALRLLPGRSVGRRSARALVGRRCRCRPSRPCCGSGLRPPVSRPPARPGLPAALGPASRSRRGAARLSGCRPRWPRWWRSAPRRGFVLGLARWCACGRGAGGSAGCGQRCACGRGVGVPLAAASGDGPPALAGAFRVSIISHLPAHFHINVANDFCSERLWKGE